MAIYGVATAKFLFESPKSKLKIMKETNLEIFGERLVKLSTGANGLRGALKCEVKAAGENEMDFIATDESLDRYNEKILLAGWDTKNYLANPVVVDSHDYSSVGKILGRTTALTIANGKMINRVQFATDNPLGKMAFKMARGGFIKSESVGFIPTEWENGLGGNEPDRTFTKQELLEISLVAVPANPGATIGLALKSGAVVKSDLTELAEFLKEFCSGPAASHDDSPNTGSAGNDVRLLQFARDLNAVLRRAK